MKKSVDLCVSDAAFAENIQFRTAEPAQALHSGNEPAGCKKELDDAGSGLRGESNPPQPRKPCPGHGTPIFLAIPVVKSMGQSWVLFQLFNGTLLASTGC